MKEKNFTGKIITRFAPSPTGFMHVGNLRTALYAYLIAKKENGTLILRIEDTDKEREIKGAIEHIMKVLKWVGIKWDEGPDIGGPNAPYTQSERLHIYRKYAEKLIEGGFAYPDPYTEEEVENFRKKAEEEKRPFLFRNHRPEIIEKWDGKRPLRFRVPEIKSYKWHDVVFGNLSAGPEALDDFVLIKSDGYPTYNFCHVVDDIEMGITHVIRGQEYISSMPKYLSLYETLKIEPPVFICLPHIMGKDGIKKLGKRDGAKDCLDYEKEGYLPEAMVNFLAFLGWHPNDEKELFSMKELIDAFSAERIQKSGAMWNDDKLNWFNREYLKSMIFEDKKEYIKKFIPSYILDVEGYDESIFSKIVPIILERVSYGKEITEMAERGELNYFFNEPEYLPEKLIYKDTPTENIRKNIKNIIDDINKVDSENFSKENIKERLMKIADNAGNRGEILHPVRFSLSGLDKSPDPFILAEILGKERTINRLKYALNKLGV